MTGLPSTRAAVLLALLVLAGAVGLASAGERRASRTSVAEYATAKGMLESMLDQQTGLRGFGLAEADDFLDPYRMGRRSYASQLKAARAQVDGDAEATEVLESTARAARRWQALATTTLALTRTEGVERAFDADSMRQRKTAMDRYRDLNDRYTGIVRTRTQDRAMRTGGLSLLLVVVLGGALALAGLFLTRRAASVRQARREVERDFEARQRDLNFGLQVTESEEEAQGFLHRHLEQSIPGSEVVVLKRNNSANRLLPGTPIAIGSRLDGAFQDTEPRACLAIRLAQRRTQSADHRRSVLCCELCGRLETPTTCSPLLVGGEVIGSVLIGHAEPLGEAGERTLDESVKQAAPVLANLRNLAIAEARAATDGLTGLPNRRAFEESLKRMVAHAGRLVSPLAVVAIDLDHFKAVNDVYGHGTGDTVLADVGALLAATVRDSDFVARVGGEEFMVLLADTGRDGALIICERIRTAIGALEFPAMTHGITGSLGVAVLPDDEIEASKLVRAADRMLYTAKERGRDRVEISEPLLEELADGAVAAGTPVRLGR